MPSARPSPPSDGGPSAGRLRRCVVAAIALGAAILAGAAGGRADPVHPRDAEALHAEDEPAPEQGFGDLEEMRRRGEIRVLVPYSRTSFFFDRGRPRGFAQEVFAEFGRFLNRGARRGQRIRIAFVPVPRDRLVDWLVDGRGDVAAGRLTITPERAAVVDFAAPIDRDVAEVAVTRSDHPPITAAEDLSGTVVHVRPSSSYAASLAALNVRLAAAGRPPVVIAPVGEHVADEDLAEKLEAGLIEATVVDDYKQALFSDVFPGLAFHTGAPLRSGGEIAWAVRRDSPALREALSRFVEADRRGANTVAVLERRYFVENRWLRRPIDRASLARYEDIERSFAEYAGRYGLEWTRLLAQGYRESGLDQSARNPSGAVGIMQILRETAAGHPIGLPDVHLAEVNIHAGTKYMRHLLDTYFDDPALAEDERYRFALAAYNAGPNRVSRLRTLAARAGLDPDVWYGNVEVAAARHVGREPVDYVGDIEMYLFAFRAALGLDRARGDGAARD
jgi:membrane-bound lytic murein transglycosylase MltF